MRNFQGIKEACYPPARQRADEQRPSLQDF